MRPGGGLTVATRTRAGRRPRNEDAVLVRELGRFRFLLALADGMGGHAGGEEASRRALEVLAESLASGSTLPWAVARANSAVLSAARSSGREGMGTTLVALHQTGPRYRISNVGDSRAYRIDESGIRQITQDHSLRAEAVLRGRAAEEAVARSRWRNALTRAVGTEPRVEADLYGPFDATLPHTVLLTSDGLHGSVDEELLRAHVAGAPDLDSAAHALVEDAYERGSQDNISVVLAAFGPSPPTRVPPVPPAA